MIFLWRYIYKSIVLFIFLVLFISHTYAAITTISYTQNASDIAGGSFSWSNLGNATGNTTSSFASSTVTSRNSNTNVLSLTNFDLASAGLPSNANINGIQVEVERSVSGNRMTDIMVQLTKDGINPLGSNYGNNSNGPQSKTLTTYGGLTDLWGTSWNTSDLLSSDFGVLLQYRNLRKQSRTVNIYRVNIVVDYTVIAESMIGDSLDFETTGEYNVTQGTWTRTTNNPYEGLYSLESGNNTDNSTSCFNTTKTIVEDSTFSFYKEVSSEQDYDFLRFYINGVEQGSWSGESPWSKETYNIVPGFTTFEWCYQKDGSVSNGSDTAWVDFIEVSSLSTPGGVDGMTLWLKADEGTSTTTHGTSVNTWNDQSGNNLHASAGVAPTYQFDNLNHLNFNPYIDFNGSTQYMENTNNGASSTSYFAVVVPDNQVDGTLGGNVPFAFDCNQALVNTGNCGLPFGGLVLGAFTVAINDEVITHAIGASTDWRSAQIGQASYDVSKPMLINMNENITGDGTEIREKGINLDNYNANTYQMLGQTDYRIGMSTDPANPFPFDGKIAEIINYDTRITDDDKQNVESYLSLKYGITLANGTLDYRASDSSTIFWSSSDAGIFTNNIFGIGRDDNSTLSQLKSHSINDDGIIILEADNEGTNLNPAFVDISDLEYLTLSDNGLGNTRSQIGAPSGYYVLERQWRAQESGEVGTVTLQFDMDRSGFDVPLPSIGTDYYFLYDSNNNNSFTDETPQVMTNIGGSIWEISGVDIDHLREFTIASEASTNSIPTNITLSNSAINENIAAGSTIGTFSSSDSDLGDSHTYTLVSGVGDEDNIYMNIIGNTLSLIHSPDYEIKQSYNIRIQTDDGNGGQFQKNFVITINNLGESVPSSLDFENAIDDYKYTNTSGIWSRTTNNPYEGLYSLESDNGGVGNTQSCFEVNNTLTQVGTINFYYSVSSQANSDYLRFYIDNVEQQAWSGDIPWTLYEKNDVPAGSHIYKWCYIKDGTGNSGSDNAYIDFVATQPTTSESNPPVITNINYISGALLPGGSHTITIDYFDSESGINTTSDIIALYKWNGTSWGSDISTTGFTLGAKTVTSTQANYPTNNLEYGKYRYDFQISDNDFNSSSTGAVFYIDRPLLTISTGSLDLGTLNPGTSEFSNGEITIHVQTLGAPFDVHISKDSELSSTSSGIIIDWDGGEGVGYESSPYSGIIQQIANSPILASELMNVNTDGNYNTYTYRIKIGSLIGELQAAGNYSMNLSFYVSLSY